MQTKISSFYEACINIIIGFSINYLANFWLIPAFVRGQDGLPVHIDPAANWWMGCAFTVISMLRQYAIRRWFNSLIHRGAEKIAGWQA